MFNEQRNGQYETDYASEPKTFHISVVPGFRASFYNYDHTLLESGLFPAGTTPVYSGPTPLKPGGTQGQGYRFTGWDPEPGPITGSADYAAQFSPEQVEPVIFSANGGSGTMEEDSYFVSDGEYRLPECGFTPPAGKVFVSWIVSYNKYSGETMRYHLSPGSLLTGLTGTVIVSAEWQQLSLEVSPRGAGTAEFDQEEGIFTATANPGYTFDHWEYSNGGADVVPVGMVWPEDNPFRPGSVDFRYYTAVFSRDPQELTVKPNVAARGAVTYRGTLETGRRITLTAAPRDGYEFKGWQTYPEDIEISSQNKIKMPACPVTVTAIFEPINPPEFKTCTLLLTGQIGVNFYADLSGLAETERENVAVVFSVNGKTFTDTFDPTCTDPDGNDYFGFTCFVNSIEMADGIEATLCWPGGGQTTVTYSVKDYVDYVLENTDEFPGNAVALVRAIADYGHYVQQYFEPIRNWTLGVDHAAMPAVNVFTNADADAAKEGLEGCSPYFSRGEGSPFTGAGLSLALDSETSMRVWLTCEDGFDGEATTNNAYDVLNCVRQENGRYLIEVEPFPAYKLDETRVILVLAGDSEATISVSPLAYAHAVLETSSDAAARFAVTALYRYYLAAKAYYENPNG
ncbi:MAG: InlB B-repeat-containing protein [Clostridia bacterium]|nr:InlB B-repeat-containing protein [Clostridia bacterium]